MAELRVLSCNVQALPGGVRQLATLVRACTPDVVAVQGAPRMLRWRSKRAAIARTCGLVVATADRPGGLFLMTTLAVRVVSTNFVQAAAVAELELRGTPWIVASAGDSFDVVAALPTSAGTPFVVAGESFRVEGPAEVVSASSEPPVLAVLRQTRL